MKKAKLNALALAVSTVVTLAGCGGGGSGGSTSAGGAATTDVAGKVADGYITGAKVCLDTNANGQCDVGEPTATTGANGAYALTGVSSADAAKPLLVEVPASAVDSDNAGAPIGKSFVLKAPAGSSFVSPLTTLVQQKIEDGSAADVTAAITAVRTALANDGGVTISGTVDLLKDYVAEETAGTSGYADTHKAAQVLAKSFIANYDVVKDGASSPAQLKALQKEATNQALKDLKANQSAGVANPAATVPPTSAVLMNAISQAPADNSVAAAATQDVSIAFDVLNGDTPVRCGDAMTVANTALWDHAASDTIVAPATAAVATKLGTPGATGAQSTSGKMVDLRFFVSGLALLDAKGNLSPVVLNETNNQSKGVALLDFGNNGNVACTTTYVTSVVGKVKPGTYTGVVFTVGVPVYAADGTRLNHSNAADDTNSLPMRVTQMAWTWQGGRKFMKIEFKPDTAIDKAGASTTSVWNMHLGSTGCGVGFNGNADVTTGGVTACSNPNRVKVRFDSFDAGTQKVALDLAELYKTSDLSFDGGMAAGCMSGGTDPECAPVFKQLGLNLGTGLMDSSIVQTVFKAKVK